MNYSLAHPIIRATMTVTNLVLWDKGTFWTIISVSNELWLLCSQNLQKEKCEWVVHQVEGLKTDSAIVNSRKFLQYKASKVKVVQFRGMQFPCLLTGVEVWSWNWKLTSLIK